MYRHYDPHATQPTSQHDWKLEGEFGKHVKPPLRKMEIPSASLRQSHRGILCEGTFLLRTQHVHRESSSTAANRDTVACFPARARDPKAIVEVHTTCTGMGIDAANPTDPERFPGVETV